MSTTTMTAPAQAPSPAATPGRWQRHRTSLLIGAGLLLAVVVAVVLGTGTRTATPMDPDNPGPDGTRAVARVLTDQGVQVEVARSAADLEALPVDATTTVAVVDPSSLGTSTVARLREHAAGAAQLVVVAPGPGTADLFGAPGGGASASLQQGRAADCDDPRFTGLTLRVDSASTYRGPGCFRGPGGSVVVEPEDGLTLFGADQALTNDQVLRGDNAAVALRLLGQTDRLVVYVPDLADLAAGDGVSLRSLLPPWVVPGLVLVLLSAVALVLWRGRRLGPLASEPLPVVVRAAETTQSLGRLYRRAGDRGHAATALRRASRVRLAERLRLGSTAPADVVVREVARRTDRREDDVRDLLGEQAPVPPTDRDLITLAADLAALDREVPRT